MAEIYIFGTDKPPYKVGCSRSSKRRRSGLRHNRSQHPHDCSSGTIKSSYPIELENVWKAERAAHKAFSYCRIGELEWFDAPLAVLQETISKIVSDMAGPNPIGEETPPTYVFHPIPGWPMQPVFHIYEYYNHLASAQIGRPRKTEALAAEALKLRGEGLSLKAIGTALGASAETIRSILRAQTVGHAEDHCD
jgi:hypothetical protein